MAKADPTLRTVDTLYAETVASKGVYFSNGKVAATSTVETIVDHVRAGGISR